MRSHRVEAHRPSVAARRPRRVVAVACRHGDRGAGTGGPGTHRRPPDLPARHRRPRGSPVTLVLGRYEVDERARVGTVTSARDEVFGEARGVLRLPAPDDGSATADLVRHLRRARDLHAPHVAWVLDVAAEEGSVWLVVEPGHGTLADLTGTLDVYGALEATRQVGDGARALRGVGLEPSLAPELLLLDGRGDVLVLPGAKTERRTGRLRKGTRVPGGEGVAELLRGLLMAGVEGLAEPLRSAVGGHGAVPDADRLHELVLGALHDLPTDSTGPLGDPVRRERIDVVEPGGPPPGGYESPRPPSAPPPVTISPVTRRRVPLPLRTMIVAVVAALIALLVGVVLFGGRESEESSSTTGVGSSAWIASTVTDVPAPAGRG